MKVCTYFNELVVDPVLRVWLPTLRRHYAGDVVLFFAGDCDLTRAKGARVQTVDTRPLATADDQFGGIVRAWARYTSALPAGEPVLIFDAADVMFQAGLDPLAAEVAGSDKLRCMVEPRGLGGSPSMLRTLTEVLPAELCGKYLPELLDRRLLNTSLLAARAEVLTACFQECVDTLVDGCKGNWIAAQAWLNLYALLHPGTVEPLHPRWCFDLRWFKYTVSPREQYVSHDDGALIPVVHAAGHQTTKTLFGAFRGMRKEYNSLAQKARRAQ